MGRAAGSRWTPGRAIRWKVLSLKRERDMRPIRGGAISMIFQEPMASFAPAITVGNQMVEQLLIHTDMGKREAREYSIHMLDRVGITEPARRIDQYVFEYSGGHAPAGDDRHGALDQAPAADRRRTHDCRRRDGSKSAFSICSTAFAVIEVCR